MLKNMVEPPASSAGRFSRMYVPGLVVHPHVVIRMIVENLKLDDMVDRDGKEYRWDRLYAADGLVSLVSPDALANIAPAELLDEPKRDILKGTLEDIVVKCGVGEEAARRMSLEDLAKRADQDCARDFIPLK